MRMKFPLQSARNEFRHYQLCQNVTLRTIAMRTIMIDHRKTPENECTVDEQKKKCWRWKCPFYSVMPRVVYTSTSCRNKINTTVTRPSLAQLFGCAYFLYEPKVTHSFAGDWGTGEYVNICRKTFLLHQAQIYYKERENNQVQTKRDGKMLDCNLYTNLLEIKQIHYCMRKGQLCEHQ